MSSSTSATETRGSRSGGTGSFQREHPNQRQHEEIPVNITNIPASSLPDKRIVLLGKSGVGKSATGNTILGQKMFKSQMGRSSITRECSMEQATDSGRNVSVVDTPSFFDTHIKTEESAVEIARSVYLSSPGPHAFLIVFPVNQRFTEQEEQIIYSIETLFGDEALKYSVILFTHGDQLEEKSVEELIEENCKIRDLVQQCGGRYHMFNNKDQTNREQVIELLQKIDTMIEQNGGGHYSNEMLEEAQRCKQGKEKKNNGRNLIEERRRSEEEMREEMRKREEEMNKREEEMKKREEEMKGEVEEEMRKMKGKVEEEMRKMKDEVEEEKRKMKGKVEEEMRKMKDEVEEEKRKMKGKVEEEMRRRRKGEVEGAECIIL